MIGEGKLNSWAKKTRTVREIQNLNVRSLRCGFNVRTQEPKHISFYRAIQYQRRSVIVQVQNWSDQ